MCLKLCTTKRVKIKDGRTILIRRPKMSDAKQLKDYINSLVDEDALILQNEKKTLKEERVWLKDALKKIKKGEAHALVGIVDGKIAGFTNLSKDKGRRSHVAEYGISTAKKFRRFGVASALTKRILEIGRRDKAIKVIMLCVFSTNKIAISMYRKFGFKKVATLKNRCFYKNKLIDEFVMDLKR